MGLWDGWTKLTIGWLKIYQVFKKLNEHYLLAPFEVNS
jgi:hypothetical protein